MLVEKTKKGDRYRIAMGHGRSPSRRGLAPWSMAFGSRQQKNPTALGGVKGACLLGLPPPQGERGGHPRNFHTSSKNSEGISKIALFSF
jgi:hypothetical protein